MKYRESGMPSEPVWDTFFSPLEVLRRMGVNEEIKNLLDIGCGYGTFLFPAASLVSGRVVGIDIDEGMIETCKAKAQGRNSSSVDLIHGDISVDDAQKTLQQYEGKIDYITLFNLLHCEEPVALLKKAHDVLNTGGRMGVIHWKQEQTPRGPSMEIRPKPEMIMEWAANAGFALEKHVELPPYHFGLVFIKKP